ncbi:MAG: 3-deoxy-D-manno-octulosonic acid transferase, partial [Lentisphaeria bacterium]|nr:3-deoxy-D-manno-octulosonic acid transferase [Lentisphaeria bacterium]
MLFIYNLLLPLGVLFFLPGLWWKYRHRPGWKATYGERFGRFSPERVEELKAWHGSVWIHAVSVGESVVALSLIRAWQKRCPEQRFVLSTTTTTGQELARKQAPEGVAVIFCPIDFRGFVRRTFDVVRPAMVTVFETEIWPNLVAEAAARQIPLTLVNARMSDHSARGYRRIRCFIAPLLNRFAVIAAQSEQDAERFRMIAPQAVVETSGNIKFDQSVPAGLEPVDFAACFGPDAVILLAGSTHPG